MKENGETDGDQADLRGGKLPWTSVAPNRFETPVQSFRCDAVIVGAGITGALVAEQLTRQGLSVAIVEREKPTRGSTSASTAMLLWEIDQSLHDLSELYDFERAARAYRASMAALNGLQTLLRSERIACSLRLRPSLYLAAGDSPVRLKREHDLRQRAGLPGDFLDSAKLASTFGMIRPAALLSPGSADADPVQLSESLIALSARRGARLIRGEAIAYDATANSVSVGLASGPTIEAKYAVLATGYVMPDFVRATIQSASSSWAIATAPQPQNLWNEQALIWEDDSPYLYARTTSDGRIIVGGEDQSGEMDQDERDRLIPQKSPLLRQKLEALWPRAEQRIDFAWSGAFDTTRDGLPLIGPVPRHPHIYAAYGYGGNGITFSYLAAELIGGLIAGRSSKLLDDVAIARD